MVIGGGSGSDAIFLESDSKEKQLFRCLFGWNRLLTALCKKLPKKYFDTSSIPLCRRHLKANFIGTGSLVTTFNVAADSFPDAATALSQLQSSLGSNTDNDGFSPLSVSVSAVGISSSSSSSSGANLGLILGLSIPLTILLVLIIVILAVRNKDEVVDTA